jgi:hypothetical protein
MPTSLITFADITSKYIPPAENIFLLILGGLVVRFAKPYLTELAKNRALKRDNREVTKEDVKADFQARYAIRFAALDKRLQAHQEAFGLCRRMLMDINKISLKTRNGPR